MNFNRVIMVGRLTRDPETKYTAAGTLILSASFVTNGRRKQGEEWVDEPCFIDITCFGGLAERVAPKLQKATQILIEGRLKQHRWESDDGTKRSKHEIVVDSMKFLTATEKGGFTPSGGYGDTSGYDESDNIPF